MNKIRLVIADDQMLTREGLRTILDLEEDMEVVGLAKNGEEACSLAESLQPDILLLDIQMPRMDGIEALGRIKSSCPEARVLILTTFIETDYIVQAMASGANGYMLKDMDGDKMIASIRDTMNGQFVLPGAVAGRLAARMNEVAGEIGKLQPSAGQHRADQQRIKLTEREKELARLMLTGLNNREIAETLRIAEGTVRNYISSLYGKLEVVDRAQAILKLQDVMHGGS